MPVFIEEVITVRLGVRTTCLEIGYGIGVVPNAAATYVRHASGYGAYEGTSVEQALPDWKSLPVIPPYDSFRDYMRLKVGQLIAKAEVVLGHKCREQGEEVRHISSSILDEARKWRDRKQYGNSIPFEIIMPPIVREVWHHPKLTGAKCGEVIPDHVEVAVKARKQLKAGNILKKAEVEERIKAIIRELQRTMYKRSSHTPDDRACVYALVAEHKNLSKGAYVMLNMPVIVSYIQNNTSLITNMITGTMMIMLLYYMLLYIMLLFYYLINELL
jgi:hypothetical protein